MVIIEDSKKLKIKPRQFDTYMAVVKNSQGSNIWRNLYADVDGKKTDVMEDGWLSCAFYVSSILHMFKFIKEIHSTVASTVKDMEKSGWKRISKPVTGSVIVWKEGKNTNGHKHIGFYVDRGQAISNDSWKKSPCKSDWKFKGKRDVEKILWNSKIT